MHLSPDLYTLLLDGRLSPRAFARETHRHLLEVCGDCREEWQLAAARSQPARRPFAAPAWFEIAPLPAEDRYLPVADYERRRRLLSQIRQQRREARADLKRLLALPRERRPVLVARALTHLRSRAVADLLLEEAQARAQLAPKEAESLASLVPAVLARLPPPADEPWAVTLSRRAWVVGGRALLALGDAAPARARLADLRQALADEGVVDRMLAAEAAAFEAALAAHGGRFDEAARLLDEAHELYRDAGRPSGLLHHRIESARLRLAARERADALAQLDALLEQPPSPLHPHLRLELTLRRAACLIDLDRSAEARRTLARAGELAAALSDPEADAAIGLLAARVGGERS